jgi:hypothetical protein
MGERDFFIEWKRSINNFIKTVFMVKSGLLLFSVLLLSCSSYSQETLSKITKNYFRSDPFNNEFGSFVTQLVNDPALTNKTIRKRTDSTLFYFHGTYTAHNPFFFKPKRVEVVLTEIVVALDSLSLDTVYSYQLVAYNNDTEKEVQELKKEFEKIYRRYKSGFIKNSFIENSKDKKLPGATYSFLDPRCGIAPFALSWFGPNENKEIYLILTIRMETYDNMAILPIPFYTPQ